MDRCAFDDIKPPKYYKHYKWMCTGQWLEAAAKFCNGSHTHKRLMTISIAEDGSVQKNGQKHEMEESGRYPPRMGEAIIQAWMGRAMWKPQFFSLKRPRERQTAEEQPAKKQAAMAPSSADPWASSSRASCTAVDLQHTCLLDRHQCGQQKVQVKPRQQCSVSKAGQVHSETAHAASCGADPWEGCSATASDDPWEGCTASASDDPWSGTSG